MFFTVHHRQLNEAMEGVIALRCHCERSEATWGWFLGVIANGVKQSGVGATAGLRLLRRYLLAMTLFGLPAMTRGGSLQ